MSLKQFWKVQSQPDSNSRVKTLEEAQNHGDWGAEHRAAVTFFLDLSDTGTTKAPVAAWHKRLSCIPLCYQADFSQILRFNIR